MAGDGRRLFAAVALVIAMMTVSAGAQADFRTGNEFYAQCASQSAWQLYCQGYIGAVSDVMYYQAVSGVKACLPKQATAQQLLDIAIRFMAAHPEGRHYGAESLVAHALAEAFPCQ